MKFPSSLRRLAAYCRRHPVRASILGVALVLVADVGRYAFWPPVGWLAREHPASTSFMEYRREQWKIRQTELGRNPDAPMPLQRTWVPLSRISPALRKAVVTSEDDTFWQHGGFNFAMMRQALETNLAEGEVSMGGSTITQQLAKNLWFTPKRSWLRKAKEAVMTWRLERSLDKKRILELYLNSVEWGKGVYGAEAAARHYFGRSAASLTAREAASLAVMLPAPLRRTPSSPVVKRLGNRLLQRMARY